MLGKHTQRRFVILKLVILPKFLRGQPFKSFQVIWGIKSGQFDQRNEVFNILKKAMEDHKGEGRALKKIKGLPYFINVFDIIFKSVLNASEPRK